jgi:hypothetical protein
VGAQLQAAPVSILGQCPEAHFIKQHSGVSIPCGGADIPLWQTGSARCFCTIVAFGKIRVFVTVDGVIVREYWFTQYQQAGAFAADLIHDYQPDGDPAGSERPRMLHEK